MSQVRERLPRILWDFHRAGDVEKIEFVTNGRVYVAPPDARRAPFVVLFGELARPVDHQGRLTLPFVAVIRRPDGSTVVVEDAELDFPVQPESSGEEHTVILRGVDQTVAPKGSVIGAQPRSS